MRRGLGGAGFRARRSTHARISAEGKRQMRGGRARRIGLRRPCRTTSRGESRAQRLVRGHRPSGGALWRRWALCRRRESLVAFERRYRRAFTASDSFSAATDPTGPVSGASCRGPEGDSVKRSTRLNSGVEEWRSIATATKATLRSSIFRVKQDNSKQLSASPRTSVAIGCKPS